MKKYIYILLVCLVSSLSMVGCTEEEVKPSIESGNGGGASSGDKGGL
jgi:hypothetical protein